MAEKTKMKVLEGMDVYLPDVDGVINCMHNYCLNAYDKTDLTVIAPRNKKDYVDNFPYNIIRCKSFHVPLLNDYYGMPNKDKNFKEKVFANKYDIVHIHSPFNMSKFGLKVAKAQNIPAVATFHSNMRPIFQDVLKIKWLAELVIKRMGKLYNKFDEVFVCSPLVESQVRSFGYTGKVSYLPFGTDLEKCENTEELIERANKELNIGKDETVFLYVGRVMKLKRIDFILDSLKLVKDKGEKFKFFIVGKGKDLNRLKKYAKKLGFTDDEVIFTGFLPREQFPLINARANLLLFPSLYDNFGLVKVEAAAYSTAGLYIKNSCAGYGVTDGVDGFLSDDNIEAFSKKIEEAISDMDRLKDIGVNASNSIYISWKDCTKQMLERLQEVKERYNSDNKK